MALKQPNIEKASNETRRAMERASAYSLPNNPSERGMKPDDLKKAFWESIHGSSASILKEQDRIVDAINEYLLAFYDFIGNGDVLSPGAPYDEQIQEGESGLTMLANVAWRVLLDHMQQTADTPTYPTKDPHGTYSAIQRHNSSGDAHNEIRTKINRKIQDDISTHNNDSDAHIDLRNNVNQNAREIADASNDIKNIFADIGDSVLLTEAENVKSAINEVYSLALTTDETANTNRVNLVGVMAQILGIAKSYVIDSFLNFIEFINGRFTIPIFEDRDGDGIRETYEVDITYLRTGDNVLIVEQNVPDMWFEASGDNAGGALETYEYDGVEYSLIAKDETGEIVGLMHIAETDYTVIEGHAISSSVNANQSKLSAQSAKNSELVALDAASKSYTSEVNSKQSEVNAKYSEDSARNYRNESLNASQRAIDASNVINSVTNFFTFIDGEKITISYASVNNGTISFPSMRVENGKVKITSVDFNKFNHFIGNIDHTLDEIIKIQNSLIGV